MFFCYLYNLYLLLLIINIILTYKHHYNVLQDSLGSISGDLGPPSRDLSVLKKELELQDTFIQQ